MHPLAEADSFSALAAIGGLQLLPENVQQLFELKTAACLIASEEPRSGRATTPGRLQSLLSKPPVHEPLPHQVPNLLTGAITYVTGSYVVFPGWEEDSDWVAARLLEAIELTEQARLRQEARPLAEAVLRLSDAIAAQAELRRHEPGQVRPMQPAEVSSYARLKRLASAVTFTPREAEELIAPGWRKILAPLISELPLEVADAAEWHDYAASPLTWRPLVIDREGNLIVAIPGNLLVGMRHALVSIAIELGVQVELGETFDRVVAWRVNHALAGLGYVMSAPAPDIASPFAHTSFVLPLDSDKLMNLTLLGEDLSTYDTNDPNVPHNSLPERDELEGHFAAIESELLEREAPPNGVLHLVVAQTVGRPFDLIVNQPRPPLHSPRVVLSGPELEVIATLEDPDLLLLWRFGTSVARLRATVPLKPVSQLDEFMEWRNSGYSFASLMMKTAGVEEEVLLLPGGAKELREDVAARLDRHGTRGPGGGYSEIERYLEDERVGIYKQSGRLAPPHFTVVDYEDGALWVVAEDLDEYPPNWEGPRRWTELIAYWLWKLRPHLDGLAEAIATEEGPALIGVSLGDGDGIAGGAAFAAEIVGPRKVRLSIAASRVKEAFGGATNEPERSLIAEVLAVLAEAVDHHELDLAGAQKLVAERMPPNVRKLITLQHIDPAVRPITMPSRFVVPNSIDEAMHELGREVAAELSLEPGPVPAELTHRVLNVAVSALFERLEQTVGTLGEGTLEWLVTANEALVQRGVMGGLELASEVACYGSEIKVVDRRLRQSSQLAPASISNRFLIEYVAAQPPSGLRPISYAVYDLLMALSKQIVDFGTLSDLINYELADVEAVLLPTGRFAAWPAEGHRSAQQIFSGQVASGDVRRSIAWIDAHLTDSGATDDGKPSEAEVQLEVGFAKEFGFGFEETIRGLYSLCEAGMDGHGCVVVPVAEAAEVIVDEIGGDIDGAQRMIETYSLSPRQSFFPPPEEFSREDLYPWRFNRRLSYLRRPLLLRGDRLVYGPAGVYRTIEYLENLVLQGRMWAQTRELKTALSALQSSRGTEFNARVADLYAARSDCWCQARIKKINGLRIEREPGQELGDIDVLVVNPAERLILAIETKALAVALTPHQLHNEIRETFDPSEHSALTRHTERRDWLDAHRADVLAHAAIPADDPESWQTQALIAVDEEVFSPLLKSAPMPVRAWQELVILLEEGKML